MEVKFIHPAGVFSPFEGRLSIKPVATCLPDQLHDNRAVDGIFVHCDMTREEFRDAVVDVLVYTGGGETFIVEEGKPGERMLAFDWRHDQIDEMLIDEEVVDRLVDTYLEEHDFGVPMPFPDAPGVDVSEVYHYFRLVLTET